jgi:hypothetical protein
MTLPVLLSWAPVILALLLLAAWWRRRARALANRALTGYAANRAANRRLNKRGKNWNH